MTISDRADMLRIVSQDSPGSVDTPRNTSIANGNAESGFRIGECVLDRLPGHLDATREAGPKPHQRQYETA